MYYEIDAVFEKKTVIEMLHKMRISCCFYYKDQFHCSRYALVQGIELDGFIRINNRPKICFIGFVVLSKIINKKKKNIMKRRKLLSLFLPYNAVGSVTRHGILHSY
jgi:hypothetical protein